MTSSKVAGTRLDRSGQYVPTINGVDISPTSFDESRALRIAEEQIAVGKVKTKAQEAYDIFSASEAGIHVFHVGDKMQNEFASPNRICALLISFFEDWFTDYHPVGLDVTFDSIKEQVTAIFNERYDND